MVLTVLFEDADLLAVDKPAGLLSVPGGPAGSPSALELLRSGGEAGLLPVHRLDRAASGVLLFARTPEAHRHLNRQFETRAVEKEYLALVHGLVGRDQGRVARPLRAFGSGRVGVDDRRGRRSLTEYAVLERLPAHTLLEVRPHTGRRHQIRVHLYSLGHPVVGDRRYGDPPAGEGAPRLMLHARSLTVRRPAGEAVSISAPTPAEFISVVEALRGAAGQAG